MADFSNEGEVAQMNKRFTTPEQRYRRCRKEAGPAERTNPALRCLFDGNLAFIERLLKAAKDKSGPRIISNLRELIPFDRLIWLHLGQT